MVNHKLPAELNIIILAAGSSSRLGMPKQLLLFRGQTLLEHTVVAALSAAARVIVVTGAFRGEIETTLKQYDVSVAVNKNWESGMSGSIITGLDKLLEVSPDAQSAVISVSDQALIGPEVFLNLLKAQVISKKGIVASTYDEVIGTPVLFTAKFFPSLRQLTGQQGARKLIDQFPGEVEMVPFNNGGIDVDTMEDYHNLIRLDRNGAEQP